MVKSYLKKWSVVCAAALLFCASCGDSDLFDSDKWADRILGWSPNFTVQVAYGDFSMWDLLNQGKDSEGRDTLIVREGDRLFIEYTKKNIDSIKVNEVFDMQPENVAFQNVSLTIPVSGTVPAEGKLVSGDFDTDLANIPAGCSLTKMIASGTLRYKLPVMSFGYNVNMLFGNIYRQNNTVLSITQSVNPGDQEEYVEEVLDHVEVRLDGNKTVKLNVTVTIPAGETVNNEVLNMDFALQDLTFIQAEGTIKYDEGVQIDPGDIDLDVDFLDEIEGDFKFTDPVLNLIVRKEGIEVPFALQKGITFTAQDKNGKPGTMELTVNELASTGHNPDTLAFNQTNSTIVEFLSLPPSGGIQYTAGSILINPKSEGGNVVRNDGVMYIDANIRVPLKLSATGLVYRDTLSDVDGIDTNISDKIEKAAITMDVVNGVPLELAIDSIILLDQNYNQLTAVKVKDARRIKAAEGEKTVSSKLVFEMSKEQARLLSQMYHIGLGVKCTTNDEVEVKPDAKLSLNLCVQAQANIGDFDF